MEQPCQHPDFCGHLNVNRLEDTQDGPAMLFMLDIKVHCVTCNAVLTFNLPQGIDLKGIAMSPDGEEVRISAQIGTPKPPQVRGFFIHPMLPEQR